MCCNIIEFNFRIGSFTKLLFGYCDARKHGLTSAAVHFYEAEEACSTTLRGGWVWGGSKVEAGAALRLTVITIIGTRSINSGDRPRSLRKLSRRPVKVASMPARRRSQCVQCACATTAALPRMTGAGRSG